MAQIDILEDVVVPESPRTVDNEQLFVYVPIATYDNKGIASFSSDDFVIENGKVMLRVRLSEFEKTLSKKLDKYDKGGKGSILYGVTDDGEQAMFLSDRFPIEDTIAIRDENGNVKTNRPVENNDAINKFYGHNTFANALKGSVSGSVVAMKDVSPLEHELDVKVSSKNLFELKLENFNSQNIELTDSGFTVSESFITYNFKDFVMGETYFISGVGEIIAVEAVDAVGNILRGWYNIEITQGVAFTVPYGAVYMRIYFYGADGGTYSNIQVEKGTVGTPYAPYLDDVSSVEVKRYGKNLYPPLNDAVTVDGVTATFKNGYVTFTGEVNADAGYARIRCYYEPYKHTIEAGSYAVGYPDDDIMSIVACTDFNNEFIANLRPDKVVTLSRRGYIKGVLFDVYARHIGKTYPLILKATDTRFKASDEFEPYIELTTYAVEADGTVKGVMPLYPSTTLMTDNRAIIECEYNRDINKAFEELRQIIISLGGNI